MTGTGDGFTELSLRDLLDGLERPEESSAGGTAAALTAASAASVVTMVARGSPQWDESRGVAAQARRLRSRLVPLARADAEAFGAALAALAEPFLVVAGRHRVTRSLDGVRPGFLPSSCSRSRPRQREIRLAIVPEGSPSSAPIVR